MSAVRNLLAGVAVAATALFGAVAGQAAVLTDTQVAVAGPDYTFNTVLNTPTSAAIGPVSYAFVFTPATADVLLTAAFVYTPVQLPNTPEGTFTGGFVTFSDGINTVTAALVAGVQTTLAVPLAAAGPNQTLTVGFGEQSGFGSLIGLVSAAKDEDEGVNASNFAAIPLPASGLLLLAGLGLAGLARRRKAA